MSYKHVDNDVKNTGTPNTSLITAEWARVYFNGKADANTKYYMSWNVAGGGWTASKDATSPFIDTVGIVRTLGEGLTLNLGKQFLLFGGTETVHENVDQYITSNFWTQADALGNQFGATLAKEFAGQTLSIQTFNGNLESKAAEGQSRYGWAASWAGDLAKGMVKPSVGYTVRPEAASGKSRNLLGVGAQFNVVPSLVIEADYGLDTQKKAGTNNVDLKTTTIVGLVSYTGMEKVTPFAKFFKDTYKTTIADGSKEKDVTAWGLGLELKESKEDAMRYHVAYTSAQTKPVTGTKSTVGTIFLGAKMDLAILK
jgi:hypothetical protein